MGAVLARWPFLDGGATAVLVATIFDGATVEEELLWRGGGRVAARPGGGVVEVRLGACGFELVLPRACDGEAEVGGRSVELGELSSCGVTVLPLGPRARVTVRAGLVSVRVVATTPPKRLPAAAPVSWRRFATAAAAAAMASCFVVAVQATAPRRASLALPESVRVRVSLLTPPLRGGRAPSLEAQASEARAAQARVAQARVAQARVAPRPVRPQPAVAQKSSPRRERASELASREISEPEMVTRAASTPAATEDDARRAAAVQARAAGIVGMLAQSRAAFLGDVHVAAAELGDSGSFGLGAGGSSSGTGTLSGDDAGDAYGEGGLGLAGSGAGGGGSGDGTIGLGDIGTIGCGCGDGAGVGYGEGRGGLGTRHASVPVLVFGAAQVRGSCDKDLIRRVVRAHVNELRYCYERVLQSRPALNGRVASRFVIGFDGRVAGAAIASSELTPAVDSCVAQAIARWQFPPLCVGEVSYPFLFEPADGVTASAP